MEFEIDDEFKRKGGIYFILNNVNGKYYVGSAADYWDRFLFHSWQLKNKRHDNSYLQRSYDKHGRENFSFNLLERVNDKINLLSREQFYIDLFDAANPELGYNLTPTAGSNLGTKRTQESKDKASRTHGRRILKLNLDGSIAGIYDSVSIAARECGVSLKGITKTCVTERGTYKGFKWRFETPNKKFGPPTKGIKSLQSSVEKRVNTLIQKGIARPIKHYDESGNYVATYDSLYFAVKATGFKPASIKNVCNGHRKSLFGHTFSND